MSKVKIEGNASGTGTLTISAPNTDTDRSLTLPDGAGEILLSDGDGSNLTGIDIPTVGYGAFSATFENQSISQNTNTKINFSSELTDYDSLYDPSNARYQPDVAGLYFINSFIQFETPYNGRVSLKLYKNGSMHKEIITESPNTANYPSATFTAMASMNGSTDYLEMYVNADMGTGITIYGSDWGNFNGYLVRKA